MDTYSLLRQIADSWVLLAMFGFFMGTAIWAFLPSQSRARQDAAMIPFRDDDAKAPCKGTCATCACAPSRYTFEDKHNV
ncbi:cbb3-type cytochrome c oxidase subunit 3 [Sulfitobacter sp. PR48]|uniref:cbb3-type cytochrome c oxidase subunit 3 n=1 Tax=unclassified Sulfitobacter TaxID=196795 RepID=UPI0022B06FFA|nr:MULTISPECIES: cbb3-type cytochrome c oxidase subunit 3 [unclassified Sulfitobacter]MCZ4254647.1 cbb3-type cytochrome c oxidase subunit 3 [Sulfitobacter sp. G21635-S1]MDD9720278.1 cbb3-type cytochrome c oxidase subunit 3 [Sulfitobacter sp. PR48]